MKLSIITTSLTLTALIPAMASAYQVGGGGPPSPFDVFGRPYVVSRRGRSRFGSRSFSGEGRNGGRGCSPGGGGGPSSFWKNQNGCVDQQFEELAKELNGKRAQKFAARAQQFQRRGGGPPSSGGAVDEETLRQQEAWINRAFGLAQDVATGMASTSQEEKEVNDNIRQTKEFVDNVFGYVAQDAAGKTYSPVSSDVVQDDIQAFKVAIDVPGVKAGDIDVAVEGTREKLLVIRGKRQVRGTKNEEEAAVKEFRKVFALDRSSAIDKISVVLEDGVLMVTVPRDAAEKVASTVQISVNKVDDDCSISAPDDQTFFELELDVPGVSVANIDISIESDSDKTLIITATRELAGKETDGSPKTKKISKRFAVDEIVDTEKLTANLSNGVLLVTAPADEKMKDEFVRKIDVTQASADRTGTAEAEDEVLIKAAEKEDKEEATEENADEKEAGSIDGGEKK